MNMNRLRLFIFLFLASSAWGMAQETISHFYVEVRPKAKTLALSYSGVEEVQVLLVETDNIDEGIYEINVTRKDTHIYKIDGTDYYIEMPYCYEYCYSEKAIMKVESYGFGLSGALIFEDDLD